MMKAAGVLAFVALLLIVGVTEAPAVAFNSTATTAASCTGVQAGCTGGLLQPIARDPSWQLNNPGGSTAVWVSFANNTGAGGVVVAPNAAPPLLPGNATETFSVAIPAGFASLSLIVWADDTGGVRLDNGATYLAATNGTSAPNPVPGLHCADGGLTCTPGGGSTFLIALGGLAHTLQFDVFQTGAFTYGFLYQGDLALAPIPEPATLLLVGSALAAVGVVSRRRLQKKNQS